MYIAGKHEIVNTSLRSFSLSSELIISVVKIFNFTTWSVGVHVYIYIYICMSVCR